MLLSRHYKDSLKRGLYGRHGGFLQGAAVAEGPHALRQLLEAAAEPQRLLS